jgi:hypothetical protein
VDALGVPGHRGKLGEITVGVGRGGYAVSPASQTAQVYYFDPVTDVELADVTADGAANETTTTKLTLMFSGKIDGLSKEDITIDPGTTGAVKGLLSGSGPDYALGLSGITAAGEITVGVSRSGYRISSAPWTVPVHYIKPVQNVTLSATVDGSALTATTAMLTLTFSGEIDGLEAKDIIISAGATGAGKSGHFSHDGATYYIGVSGIKAEGEITVGVSRDRYVITPASQKIQAHYKLIVNPASASIKEKFGIPSTVKGKAGVEAAFNALHTFIQNGGLTTQPDVIKTGDWIDLEGGLAVSAYNSLGGFSHNATKAVEVVKYKGAARGTLCRLIVVGINSFNGINNNDMPHVVFHFQNIPVTRRINPGDSTTGGYEASEMRTYLKGNFLTGLNNAGVPDGVLWAPIRTLSKGPDGSGAANLSDKLWLPTEREMFGSGSKSANGETADNQARLAYYTDDNTRVKAWCGDNAERYPDMSYGCGFGYWLGSSAYIPAWVIPTLRWFCSATNYGGPNALEGNWTNNTGGVAPAFCVK